MGQKVNPNGFRYGISKSITQLDMLIKTNFLLYC